MYAVITQDERDAEILKSLAMIGRAGDREV
jgi:hypothetical protein